MSLYAPQEAQNYLTKLESTDEVREQKIDELGWMLMDPLFGPHIDLLKIAADIKLQESQLKEG